jgi:FtsH-binding integral membrane protein
MNLSDPMILGAAGDDAQVDARARFLQKTYTWLCAGVAGFAGILASFEHVPALQSLSYTLFGNPIIAIVTLLAASFAAHALAERSPINVVVYALYVVVFGLATAPLVALANHVAPGIVGQAGLITGIIFGGLTLYVFKTGRDFSFMGGVLALGLFAMIALGLGGWLFGFQLGVWYSIAGALLFSGFILYDTSRILHHYPTTAHVAAAVVLFTDVVILFQKILMILLRSRD